VIQSFETLGLRPRFSGRTALNISVRPEEGPSASEGERVIQPHPLVLSLSKHIGAASFDKLRTSGGE
jgi:hypothetical protein